MTRIQTPRVNWKQVDTENFQYTISCVESPGPKIQAMIDSAVDVSYNKFMSVVGWEKVRELFPQYTWGRGRGGLRLKDDWAVSYSRGVYEGKPAYYITHSAIEYVFTGESDIPQIDESGPTNLFAVRILIHKNGEQKVVTDSEYWDTYQKQGWKIATKSTPLLTTSPTNEPQTLTETAKRYKSAGAFISSIPNKPQIIPGQPVIAKVYHGSPDARFAEEFDPLKKGQYPQVPEALPDNQTFIELHGKIRGGFSTKHMMSGGIFFTDDRYVAQTYAIDVRAFDYQNAIPMVLERVVVLKNPKVVDMKGATWHGTYELIEQAKREGFDGVIIKNVQDIYSTLDTKVRSYTKPATSYVVFNANQIYSNSRLIDIWNKAQSSTSQTTDLQSLFNEAKKYKSVEEFNVLGFENLQKALFGVNIGDIVNVKLNLIEIKWLEDLKNAEQQLRKEDITSETEPVEFHFDITKNRYVLDDGHNRYVAARRQGIPLTGKITATIGTVDDMARIIKERTGKSITEIWKQAHKPEIAPGPLMEGAKKFKTAEEFVASKPKVYHGAKVKIDKLKAQQPIYAPGHVKGIYFAENINEAKDYGKNITEAYLDIKKPLVGNPYEKYAKAHNIKDQFTVKKADVEKWIEEQGYDGIIILKGTQYNLEGAEYTVFNKSQIKTKAQLTEIWKQAHANPGRTSLDQKMLKELRKNPDQLKNVLEIPGAWSIQWINAAEKVKAEQAHETNPHLTPQQSHIANAKKAIANRGITGDNLLDAEDRIDEILAHDKTAEIDNKGFITLYHRTTPENARKIINSGKMKKRETSLFFGTKPEGQISGYGDAVIKVKVPIETTAINDIFRNEVHLTIPGTDLGDVQIRAEVWKPAPETNKTLEKLNPKHELIARAKQAFPPTYNSREAGFVLEDGTFLDFSGKIEGGTPGTRSLDHSEIGQIITPVDVEKSIGTYTILALFEKQTGAIRFSHYPGGINITLSTYQTPTSTQLEVIRRVISENPGTALAFTVYDNEGHMPLDKFFEHPQPYTLTNLVEKFNEFKAKEKGKPIASERYPAIKAQLEQITKDVGEAYYVGNTAKVRELHETAQQLRAEQDKLRPQLMKHAWEVMKKEDQKPKERTFPFYKVGLETKTEHSVLTDDFYSPEAAIEAAKKHLKEYPLWDMAKVVEFDGIGRKVIRTIHQPTSEVKPTYEEVLAIVAKDLSGKTLKYPELVEYARQKRLPLGWVQTGYEKANPLTTGQLKHEIETLEKRRDKQYTLTTSRAQATTREANLGKLQDVIDSKTEQLESASKTVQHPAHPWQPTLKGDIGLLPQIIKKKEPQVKPKRKRPEIEPHQAGLDKTYQSTLAIGALTVGAGVLISLLRKK